MIRVGIIGNLVFSHPWRGQTKRPSPTQPREFNSTQPRARCWFQIFFFMFTPIWGLLIQFDTHIFHRWVLQPPTKHASRLSQTRFCTLQCRESAATGGESVLVSGAELLAALSNEELRNLMQPGGGSWDWKFDLREKQWLIGAKWMWEWFYGGLVDILGWLDEGFGTEIGEVDDEKQ